MYQTKSEKIFFEVTDWLYFAAITSPITLTAIEFIKGAL